MRKRLLYSTIAAILLATAPVAANAADWHHDNGHHDNSHHESWSHIHHAHINYVYWHGHRGYWNGPHFVVVEEVPPPVVIPSASPFPVVVPAYYPEPQPIYYEPESTYYNTVIR